jgi:Arc/MetJ-type ribon-helix-helix transcriptional regulator
MDRKFKQVNVNITDEDDEKLVEMMKADGFDNRSAFIRKLIRDEYRRKAQAKNIADYYEEHNMDTQEMD